RVAVARIDPVDVERAFVWAIAQIDSSHRHAVGPVQSLDPEIPAAGNVSDHFVFAKRQTTVSRLVEHETEWSGPNDINLAIWTNGGHRTLDRIVAIETVAACIRDTEGHRERLSLICRACEIDLRTVFWSGAAVN